MGKNDIQKDFDLSYILGEHGWSDFYIYFNEEWFRIIISHSFSDPVTDLIQSCLNILDQKSKFYFTWYSEPASYRLHFEIPSGQQDFLKITFNEYEEEFGDVPEKIVHTKTYFTKANYYLNMVYLQLYKNYLLLKDKNFSKNRSSGFNFEDFKKLKKKMDTLL